MTYEEAIKLAHEWTKGQDLNLDGWRSVLAILLQRVQALEASNMDLRKHANDLLRQIDGLSLDLGIKNKDFVFPVQPQLQTIADIIKECEQKS